MPSRNSRTLSGLINVSFELSEIITAQEGFSPKYKKNRNRFRRLIAARNKLFREMRKYFKGASDRIIEQIDWSAYQQKAVQADDFTETIDVDNEELILTVSFIDSFNDIYEIGVEQMEEDTGFDTGLNSSELSFQKQIREHALDLAKGLTKTTMDRISEILLTSAKEHRSVEEASKLVDKVINDKNRANTIARTETVNAHAKGILTAGREMGATGKRWLVSTDPCPICRPIPSQGVVPINKPFKTILGPKDGPTAHPNCFCLVENVF